MNKQEYKQAFDNMNLTQWMLYHQRNLHFQMKYHNLDMQKIPNDLVVYSEIIYDIKPDIIIEIGSAGGGTCLWLCHQLDILKKGKVISIDINQTNNKAKHEKLIKIESNSTDKSTENLISEHIKENNKVLIIHDGSHKKEDIKKDFENYSKYVSVGSYFIIEDGVMDVFNWKDHRTSGHDCGLVAATELIKQYGDLNWEIDKSREKYIITNNPNGFLRRKK